jgi:hypothetical protein
MKLYPTESIRARPDVLRAKHIYGIWYGAALGLTFSIFAWGIDAYTLDQIHGLYPWLKFLAGAIPSMVVGGLVGWVAARSDKPILALFLWALAASFFAWLTIGVPLQIMPKLVSIVEPGIKPLLHYMYYGAFASRFGVAYAWLVIFISLAGLLQIPLSESAVFSTSVLGKIAPMLIAFVLMGICGTIVDGLNNELLRKPIEAVNTTVQFAIDHQGKKVDPAESRKVHLRALNPVQNLVTPERKFMVSGYDQYLEQVQVLARFEQGWVECLVVNNQLVSCKQAGGTP